VLHSPSSPFAAALTAEVCWAGAGASCFVLCFCVVSLFVFCFFVRFCSVCVPLRSFSSVRFCGGAFVSFFLFVFASAFPLFLCYCVVLVVLRRLLSKYTANPPSLLLCFDFPSVCFGFVIFILWFRFLFSVFIQLFPSCFFCFFYLFCFPFRSLLGWLFCVCVRGFDVGVQIFGDTITMVWCF
jgi:hypothetical protein